MLISSVFSKEELTARFDDFTSPARFAGGDELLDDIFRAKRSGDRIRLARRPKLARNPFAPVFYGRLTASGIRGFFGVSVGDYVFLGALLAVYYGVVWAYITRMGGVPDTAAWVAVFVGIALAFLFLKKGNRAKSRYLELLKKIAESN